MPEKLFVRGQPPHGAQLADALEEIVRTHGAETIAAVLVEPMAGSAGVYVPPVGYLERLRAICDAHGILLVFDEVITGFGRLGASFAAKRFGVTPDLMTVAKGLTNGTVPMGALLARRDIHDAVVDAPAGGIEFFHGYTYSGHPLACAAALATLAVYRDEGVFERSAAMAPAWEEALHELRDAPHVIDVRNIGLVGAVELAPRDGGPGARAMAVHVDCFHHGLLTRVTGDTIALSPPLIVEAEHVARIVETLGDALRRVA